MIPRLLSKILSTIIIVLLLGCQTVAKQSECSNYPNSSGFVNDFESIFTKSQSKNLKTLLRDYEQKTSNEIVVLTVVSFSPDSSFYDYTLHVANCWGIGKSDSNNGVLIAVSKSLRQVRIQNGIGIEDLITDAETKKIIDHSMIPYFKKGNYYEGVKAGIEEIIKELN